jgi:hypothetical protein
MQFYRVTRELLVLERDSMKKRLLALALLARWEASAAATIGGAAGITAGLTGQDPWTWVIGGFGAAVVYVKRPAKSRWDAIVNSGVSVGIAGLVSPTVALYLASHVDKSLGNPHPIAFILSSAWPWLIPIAMRKLKKETKTENPT